MALIGPINTQKIHLFTALHFSNHFVSKTFKFILYEVYHKFIVFERYSDMRIQIYSNFFRRNDDQSRRFETLEKAISEENKFSPHIKRQYSYYLRENFLKV